VHHSLSDPVYLGCDAGSNTDARENERDEEGKLKNGEKVMTKEEVMNGELMTRCGNVPTSLPSSNLVMSQIIESSSSLSPLPPSLSPVIVTLVGARIWSRQYLLSHLFDSYVSESSVGLSRLSPHWAANLIGTRIAECGVGADGRGRDGGWGEIWGSGDCRGVAGLVVGEVGGEDWLGRRRREIWAVDPTGGVTGPFKGGGWAVGRLGDGVRRVLGDKCGNGSKSVKGEKEKWFMCLKIAVEALLEADEEEGGKGGTFECFLMEGAKRGEMGGVRRIPRKVVEDIVRRHKVKSNVMSSTKK